MKLRDSDRGLLDVPTKCYDSTLQHLTEQEDSDENRLFNKSRKGNDIFTCSMRDFQNDEIEGGKERKKLEQLHNINDASFRKCRKYDGLDNVNCSKQFVLDNGIESTFSAKVHNLYDSSENSENFIDKNVNDLFSRVIHDIESKPKEQDSVEVPCPICHKSLNIENTLNIDNIVNSHVDICLNNSAISSLIDTGKHKNLTAKRDDLNKNKKRRQDNSPTKSINLSVKPKVAKVNSILNYMVAKRS